GADFWVAILSPPQDHLCVIVDFHPGAPSLPWFRSNARRSSPREVGDRRRYESIARGQRQLGRWRDAWRTLASPRTAGLRRRIPHVAAASLDERSFDHVAGIGQIPKSVQAAEKQGGQRPQAVLPAPAATHVQRR